MSQARLFLVLGSGGVGKTTSAAAMAMALGERGLRSVVLTIDPAKRLAQALGLESLSNTPQLVKSFANGGSVHALWLDARTAFSELVVRYVKDEAKARKILDNRLFKIVQGQLGGIEEYLSIEKVLGLGECGDFDICVLDTPPSRHALDFLESPRHLLRFFDDGILKVFLSGDPSEAKQRGWFSRLLDSGRTQGLEIFKNFLGKTFMNELADLLEQTRPVHTALKRTAIGMESWVRRSDTRIALVSLLEAYPLDEARLLSSELLAHELPAAQLLLLNKALPEAAPPPLEVCTQALGPAAAQALINRHETQTRLKAEISARGPRTQARVLVPRSSVRSMDTERLLEIGKGILSKWESQEPQLFSKNSNNASEK
jgi:anion-transporting  ArsA/GET3 family ATPase